MSAPRRHAGVVGSPIAHSLSPVLYRAGFAALDWADWSFEAMECDAELLPSLVREVDGSWAGFAVTMPGKRAAAAAASTRSQRVLAMGVANTLVRRGPEWHAENTDVDGVTGALQAAGVSPVGTVLLLGGGGTAQAVVMALAELSWQGRLIVAGRRPESTVMAASLASSLGLAVTQVGFAEADISAVAGDLALVVSTVPAGAADHLTSALADARALLDVVYHPWPTALAATRAEGRTAITGLDMLLHQALQQFEHITGHRAPAQAMRDALREELRHRLGERLALTL